MRLLTVKNFFEIFDFAVSYKVDESELTRRYFAKQRSLHSKKNHDGSSGDNDVSYLNEAYKTLMDPIDRAEYIIKLQNLQLDEICYDSAAEMFEIHEKYNSLSSENDKKKFQDFLSHRMSVIIESLCEFEDYTGEFYKLTRLLRFIHSFLEKTRINVYSRN